MVERTRAVRNRGPAPLVGSGDLFGRLQKCAPTLEAKGKSPPWHTADTFFLAVLESRAPNRIAILLWKISDIFLWRRLLSDL